MDEGHNEGTTDVSSTDDLESKLPVTNTGERPKTIQVYRNVVGVVSHLRNTITKRNSEEKIGGDHVNDCHLNNSGHISEKDDIIMEPKEKKQHSIITIFSIWNTMMGTSILAIPWAVQQAGFSMGLFLLVGVACLACYTGYLAVKVTDDVRILRRISSSVYLDFPDACQYHLGKAGRIVALVFSQLAMFGALIVYFVLLSNFLYYIGDFIHRQATGIGQTDEPITIFNKTYTDVICKNLPPLPVENVLRVARASNYSAPDLYAANNDMYSKLWSLTRSVPAWLLIILFPLVSIKSPTILGKFAAFGTLAVVYLFLLICVKSGFWGINLDFSATHPYKVIEQFQPTFASLTGVCSLALFVHNALQTLTRAQRKPEHNGRDVIIAFICTASTYIIIGFVFFSAFPLPKSCIEDNLLNNLTTDIPVFIGRLCLFIQLLTIYPMVAFIVRSQVMEAIFKKVYPGFIHVTVLNVFILTAGLLFAMFLPSIGTIIRFSGALSGFVYIFTLPPLLTLLNKRALARCDPFESKSELPDANTDDAVVSNPLLTTIQADTEKGEDHGWPSQRVKVLWWTRVFFYGLIMLFGLANFVAQFVLFFLTE